MGFVEYRETVDYTWVVARQLDRVADAMTRIDPRMPGLGVRRVLVAVRALVAVVQPFVERSKLMAILEDAERLVAGNRHWKALDRIEVVLGLVLAELDRRKLLVRRKDIMGVVEE